MWKEQRLNKSLIFDSWSFRLKDLNRDLLLLTNLHWFGTGTGSVQVTDHP